jgi:hypothetical protein
MYFGFPIDSIRSGRKFDPLLRPPTALLDQVHYLRDHLAGLDRDTEGLG